MSYFADLDARSPARQDTPWFRYRMRWKRRRLLARALRRRRELQRVSVDEAAISQASFLAFSTMRNEMARLPHWLDHYRALGVPHFLIVDNDSDDGTADYLAQQPDVSLWRTGESYKTSRFGVDWLTCLQFRFGHGKWTLTVDADEELVLPMGRALPELTEHLDSTGRRAFGALMLDMYPKGALSDVEFEPGGDPFQTLGWFDAHGYRASRHPVFDNLWIQGGVRDRVFFGAQPERAPTLNKTPLVKWDRRYAYVTSTHQILPRELNRVFGHGHPTGVLLHSKFLPVVAEKSAEELIRRQHFENSDLYTPYYKALIDGPDLWCAESVAYEGPQQLEDLGLMARGDWG